MRLIRSKDTKTEIAVRRLVHSMGFRYRLHVAALPGRPDLVFSGRRKIIFVHGCFWHSHSTCRHYRLSDKNGNYWPTKLERTRQRDAENEAKLVQDGWQVMTVWGCELRNQEQLSQRIYRFLAQ